jgi:hypothetical protein
MVERGPSNAFAAKVHSRWNRHGAFSLRHGNFEEVPSMSSIPNSAMPHAFAHDEQEEKGSFAGGLRDLVRDNPKTAIAAGAAVLAGAVAAAAIPLVKGARAKSASGRSKGGRTKKSA